MNEIFLQLLEKAKYSLRVNQKELAKLLEISESYLSEIKRGNKPANEELISKLNSLISDDCSDSSPEEQMNDLETTATLVPMLPISAQAGSLNDFIVSVKESDCEKVVSPIKGADFALPISGDSMAPEYPNGSQVFIKKINEKAFIEWGKVYVLDTCNGVVVKILIPSELQGCVRCLSINTNPIYAPFDVSWDDVNGVYRVMLCMSIK